MSKPLSKYPEEERKEVAQRRAAAVENGCGKQAALDFLKLKKISVKVQPKIEPIDPE